MDAIKTLLYARAPVGSAKLVPAIVKCLETESVASTAILGASFPLDKDVVDFCANYSLDDSSKDLLLDAVGICRDASSGWANSACKRAAAVVPVINSARPMFVSSTNAVGNVGSSDQPSKCRRLENSLARMLLGTHTTNTSSLKVVESGPTSLRSITDRRRCTVEQECFALLNRFGHVSPRFLKVQSARGSKISDSMMEMIREMFFSSAGVDTVGGYCKCINSFLSWLCPIVNLDALTEFETGLFLRDCRQRGIHVASRHRYAFIWAEKLFQVKLFAEDELAISMCSSKKDLGPRELPLKAVCPSVDLILKIERACCDKKENPVVRIMCGFLLCLTHGVLRWSDLQRSVQLTLGRDLLMGKAVMKKKDVLTPWVAARRGFSGLDWAKSFMDLLVLFGMPGTDFVLLSPVCADSFGTSPASYATALMFVRMSLIHIGLTPREALEFTMHGWRQLYPTMSNQLGLPEIEQVAIGHWAKGSAMPQQYDALTNSLETRAKQRILEAMKKGYVVGKPGEFLGDVPVMDNSCNSSQAGSSISFDSSMALVPLQEPEDFGPESKPSSMPKVLTEGTLSQVRNSFSKKIHLTLSGFSGALCRWECGTRENPALNADFCSGLNTYSPGENVMNLCGRCYCEAKATMCAKLAKIPSVFDLRLADEELSSDGESESSDED